MKKKILIVAHFFAIFLLTNCSDLQMKPQQATHLYFDLPALVKNQLATLQQTSCKVKKKLVTNEQTQNFEAQAVDWQKELALFAESDINKPSLRGVYQCNETPHFVEYTTLDPKPKVRSIKIMGTVNQPTTIEVWIVDNNLLYQTEKRLQMTIDQQKLLGYTIKGLQKVLFKVPLHYEMQAEVICQ